MHRLILLLILLIGAALRLIGLNNFSPPGITHDEVAHWLINRDILAGQHAIYFTEAYGHEAGYHYLQTGFMLLLGDNALALRLPSAFLGLLLVAVTYALTRRLFGGNVGIIAAGATAVLLWPVFFSRLALRAISLPVLSGLSALLWWQAWDSGGLHSQGAGARRPWLAWSTGAFSLLHPCAPVRLRFLASGLLAGLSLHTYMAARAVPIFYGAWLVYLALCQRQALRARWRGVALFWLAYALVAAPLVWYLLTNPGAEYRVGEVDAPLRALLAGNMRPVLDNSWAIVRGFICQGDPLWRQNVAGRPVFDPLLGVLFYGGLVFMLWRWRTPIYGFVLFWLATSTIPSLVTIDAPSTIRMINMLPLLGVPIGIIFVYFMHKLRTFSPKERQLSTGLVYGWLILWGGGHIWGTAVSIFHTWPNNAEVQFVWQAAFTDMGVYLDANPGLAGAAIGGWSPDTMDAPTMALLLRRQDARLSYFSPQEGTLLLPTHGPILRPTILLLDAHWEAQLAAWGAQVKDHGRFTQYTLAQIPSLAAQHGRSATFGGELRFLGADWLPDGMVTFWQVTAVPGNGRRLFLHWLDEAGNIIAEEYRWDTADPQGLWQPHWQQGDLILQRHSLGAPDAVQARIGIFDPYTCTPGPCQNLRTQSGAEFVLLQRP